MTVTRLISRSTQEGVPCIATSPGPGAPGWSSVEECMRRARSPHHRGRGRSRHSTGFRVWCHRIAQDLALRCRPKGKSHRAKGEPWVRFPADAPAPVVMSDPSYSSYVQVELPMLTIRAHAAARCFAVETTKDLTWWRSAVPTHGAVAEKLLTRPWLPMLLRSRPCALSWKR